MRFAIAVGVEYTTIAFLVSGGLSARWQWTQFLFVDSSNRTELDITRQPSQLAFPRPTIQQTRPLLDQVFLRDDLVKTDPYPDARHQLDEIAAQAFAERSLTIETQHHGIPLFDHLAPISLETQKIAAVVTLETRKEAEDRRGSQFSFSQTNGNLEL